MEFAIFIVLILIISIILHEVAHGYAAFALGDPTAKLAGRLTLNPIPHIDPIGSVLIPALLVLSGANFLFGWAKPVPYNAHNLKNKRWGEGIVAVAGSATNLLLALIFAIVVRVGAEVGLPQTFIELSALVVFVNLFLGIFNLIPLPPLDGYTVLRSILPYRFSIPLQNFEKKVQSLGIFALFIFIFIFLTILVEPFFRFIVFLYVLLTGAGLPL